MSLCLFLLLLAFIGASIQDTITPTSPVVIAKENEKVTISCKYQYTVSMNNLQWYRQYPNTVPEFLVLIMESGQNQSATVPNPRLKASVLKNNKTVYLEIFPADVKDSALYYCALQPSSGLGQIYFGSGTKLIVETKKEVKPSIYKVGDSCLATDFTNHDAVNKTEPFSSKTAVRYEGQNYYSSFSIDGECQEQGSCSSSSSSSSDQSSEIEKDEKINFLSVGIFWLRILFLKTVVFNVLVTFKAWMS